jgi:hypothetical protein
MILSLLLEQHYIPDKVYNAKDFRKFCSMTEETNVIFNQYYRI